MKILSKKQLADLYLQRTPYVIDFDQIGTYKAIPKFFKQHKIQSYVYCFVFDDIIIKYGESTCISKTWGERAYRQAGHLEGWTTQLKSHSGSEMRFVAEAFRHKYKRKLTRHNMKLYVIDTDKDPNDDSYRNLGVDLFQRNKIVERECINRCIDFHGCAPVGNIDPETKWYEKCTKNQSRLMQYFEFA